MAQKLNTVNTLFPYYIYFILYNFIIIIFITIKERLLSVIGDLKPTLILKYQQKNMGNSTEEVNQKINNLFIKASSEYNCLIIYVDLNLLALNC